MPRRLPFEVLPPPADPEPFKNRLNGKDTEIWIDGDVLTVLHRHAGEHVQLSGGLQQKMNRIEGTDLWILQLKMPGWEKAFFAYIFLGDEFAQGSRLSAKIQTWYGPQAPPRPVRAEELQGKVIERTIHSDSLNEDRLLSIYIPPNAPDHDLPAFFMADGQGCREYAKMLEPLILSGKVRPSAIVGVYSGEYRGDRAKGYDPKLDLRNLEYTPQDDVQRFNNHMELFTREVPAYVAREFHISTRREDRAVFGFSNGGAFSAAAAVRHPEVFSHAMPLSLGVPPEDPKPAGPLPTFHFAAGKLETFQFATTRTYEKMKEWGANATLDILTSGHDPQMWETAFAMFAPLVFPARPFSPAAQ